ncbi:MAG: hypothetical protein ACI870_000574 [Crocinitomicaceae bacterium]
MKNIIETTMKKYFQLRKYKVDLWKNSAIASQEFILFDILNTAAHTEFGKKYSFTHIQNLEEFQKIVPLSSYDELKVYIKKMIEGQEDILWPGKITNFSKTSGTTCDVSKYLPITHDSLYKGNYKAGRDIYTFFFSNHPDSDIFKNNGKVISLSGTYKINDFGSKIGDVSAIIVSELPSWAEKYREPSLETLAIPEWKNKIPAIINDTVDKNITQLSGVPTWFVSVFEELQKKHPYETLRDIWPNMELFLHGAVAFGPYKSIFQKLLPFPDMKYMEVYNASEGFFAIQDDMQKPGEMLLLTDHGVFYEFIEMSQYGSKKNATVISLKDVVVGIDYAMIISTNAGLWRYDLGDTVYFTNIDPFRIKISGRTKHFINVFGEELMVGNADEAVENMSREFNCIVEHYTAGPVFMNKQGKGCHEWVIEFNQEPDDINLFKKKLDISLQEINSDYAAKRQGDVALQELVLNSVPKGTFIKWMEQRGKLGGQHKIPRLSNKRKYIEELLNI